jgi:hypothetical protein
MTRSENGFYSLDDLMTVVSLSGSPVLLPVVLVGVEWPFVRRGDEDYIDHIGIYPVHHWRRISLHMPHVAIRNTGRRKW